MRTFKLLLAASFFSFIFYGCEVDPTSNDDSLEVSQFVKDQAPVGWQLNKTVVSGSEMKSLTQNSDYLEDEGVEGLSKMSALKSNALLLNKEMKQYVSKMQILGKTNGDSLLFFEDNTVIGVRKGLYYNSETSIARYYEVKYKFAAWRNIEYDSSHVTAFLNFTLDYDGDDQLKTLHQLQTFEEGFFVQKIQTNAEVTDWDESDVTGIIATTDAWYESGRQLSHLKQMVEIKPDESGTLREDFDFRDGKTAYRQVTFKNDGTGTFEKKTREGILVSGTFDSVEDDLQGSYSETIDFPEGRYIDKIVKNAQVSVTLPDSIFNADFSEAVYFESGRVDSERVALQVSEEAGVTTSVFEITKSNGAHGTLTINETENESNLDGNWISFDGSYIVLSAEYYFDGSSHLHYEVFESETAYDNGDDPLIVADYYFSPDQTCTGTLSYEGETYDVNFNDSGEGELSQGGKKSGINLFK
ncbi:MAG: hypothetical protein D8M58_12010 [Calditrichaeota bacterium]|nr:MAG: hypothetical protein DWQ03_12795 [Calditrichota bacterium]MBL1206120.1 hypothetical protein [Calditrichota bacterium]NOG45945.1 hypothetical protein [Calditrichota bacterium]